MDSDKIVEDVAKAIAKSSMVESGLILHENDYERFAKAAIAVAGVLEMREALEIGHQYAVACWQNHYGDNPEGSPVPEHIKRMESALSNTHEPKKIPNVEPHEFAEYMLTGMCWKCGLASGAPLHQVSVDEPEKVET